MSSVAHLSPTVQGSPASDTPVMALWSPSFPSPAGLDLAAMMFDARPAWAGEEGPRPRIVISAGAFAISAPDLARRDRRHERAEKARQLDVDVVASYLARGEKPPPEPVPCREITEWSRKSRANMVRALCELDYRPLLADPTRIPAMVTLTYPGDWLTVAPNGKVVKKHIDALRKRYKRSWGRYVVCPHTDKPVKPKDWIWNRDEADIEWRPRGHQSCTGTSADCWEGSTLTAVWKLEFQHRGAPHFHLLMVPPHGTARIPDARARADARVGAGLVFREWLSVVWADIVGADDQLRDDKGDTERDKHLRAGTGVDFEDGLKSRDPKRVAVYFTKHGSFAAKEYQHRVPAEWQEPGAGPGRFWGYWNLQRRTAAIEVTPEQAVQAARIARRWAHAQGTTRLVSVPRTPGGRPRPVELVQSVAGAQLLQRAGPTRRRNVRRRVRRFASGKGFVSVNNGQTFAMAMARALSLT